MLDLDHPMTSHIFSAASLCDVVMILAKRMTFASSGERIVLLQNCQERLKSLARLNEDHFGTSPFIISALQELEVALRGLAGVEVDEATADRAASLGQCPVCDSVLERMELPYNSPLEGTTSVWCRSCLEALTPSLRKLDSTEGFGTWLI